MTVQKKTEQAVRQLTMKEMEKVSGGNIGTTVPDGNQVIIPGDSTIEDDSAVKNCKKVCIVCGKDLEPIGNGMYKCVFTDPKCSMFGIPTTQFKYK